MCRYGIQYSVVWLIYNGIGVTTIYCDGWVGTCGVPEVRLRVYRDGSPAVCGFVLKNPHGYIFFFSLKVVSKKEKL